MKPLVYIAGPYTNPDPVENTNRAINVGMRLYETELAAVEIPHVTLLMHMVAPRPIDYWYQLDIDKLAHCNFVWRMRGASTGAAREVAYAESVGIPVFCEAEDEWNVMLDALMRWKP